MQQVSGCQTVKMLGSQVFPDHHHIDYVGYYVYGTDTFKVNVFIHYQVAESFFSQMFHTFNT